MEHKALKHLQHALNILATENHQINKRKAFGGDTDNQQECPVCYGEFERNDMLHGECHADHKLCQNCMQTVQASLDPRCPLCRGDCLSSYNMDGSLHRNVGLIMTSITVNFMAHPQCSWDRQNFPRKNFRARVERKLRNHFNNDNRVRFAQTFKVIVQTMTYSQDFGFRNLEAYRRSEESTNSNLVFIQVHFDGRNDHVPIMADPLHKQNARDIMNAVEESMGGTTLPERRRDKLWVLNSKVRGYVCTFRVGVQYVEEIHLTMRQRDSNILIPKAFADFTDFADTGLKQS